MCSRLMNVSRCGCLYELACCNQDLMVVKLTTHLHLEVELYIHSLICLYGMHSDNFLCLYHKSSIEVLGHFLQAFFLQTLKCI